jgi:ABC-type transporter Mla maintaining outer membrane lipid asymmetry permease subunit MlaE
MRTWMFIDLMACIPFQFILATNKSYEGLVRVARLPRLYRLIKMAKLARMLKIIKHRKKIIRNMNNMMRVSYAVERLLWFFITFVITIHLIA